MGCVGKGSTSRTDYVICGRIAHGGTIPRHSRLLPLSDSVHRYEPSVNLPRALREPSANDVVTPQVPALPLAMTSLVTSPSAAVDGSLTAFISVHDAYALMQKCKRVNPRTNLDTTRLNSGSTLAQPWLTPGSTCQP